MSIAEHVPKENHETLEIVQDKELQSTLPAPTDAEVPIGSLEDYEQAYPSTYTARLARLGDIVWKVATNGVLNDAAPENHPDERGL